MTSNPSQNALTKLINEKLETETLLLPTLAEVATEVREAIDQHQHCSTRELAQIISRDPATAARLIQVANSPLYSSGINQIDSIEKAILLLGQDKTSSLVTSIAIKQFFSPEKHSLSDLLAEIHQQTLSVASISRGMALFAPNLNPETAMLAGLVHQIGKLPLLQLLDEVEISLQPEKIQAILEDAHQEIGTLILKKWGFPTELVAIPNEYLLFDDCLDEEVTYTDIVMVAYLQSCVGSTYPHSNIDWSTVCAFKKLGIKPTLEVLSAKNIKKEIEEALAALS